jgi:hypothetical protein
MGHTNISAIWKKQKKWIEACIGDELPPTAELEEALRNGVILARLGHFCAPDVVPLSKIYDSDQAKYHANGLGFRHTENINWWIRTLEHVGLPQEIYPTTLDLYDKKNMPKVIYCIHALGFYLHNLGKAPPIEDQLGKAQFTEEEISAVQQALDKYKISLPSFGKIGGVLADKLSTYEAAGHAVVMAINEALEKGDINAILRALQEPAARLEEVQPENSSFYQVTLLNLKKNKAAKAEAEASL